MHSFIRTSTPEVPTAVYPNLLITVHMYKNMASAHYIKLYVSSFISQKIITKSPKPYSNDQTRI